MMYVVVRIAPKAMYLLLSVRMTRLSLNKVVPLVIAQVIRLCITTGSKANKQSVAKPEVIAITEAIVMPGKSICASRYAKVPVSKATTSAKATDNKATSASDVAVCTKGSKVFLKD
jgi:hypothetical protein